MKPVVSQEEPPIYAFLYDWSSFGGVISTFLLHVTSCLAPLLEGVPNMPIQQLGLTTL
jgi:hypothetical protein